MVYAVSRWGIFTAVCQLRESLHDTQLIQASILITWSRIPPWVVAAVTMEAL